MYIFTVIERRTNSTDRSNLWPLTPIFAQITLFYNALSWLPLPPELRALPLQSACSSWKQGTALSTENISSIFLQVPCSWRGTRLNHPAKVWWCTGPVLEQISHATKSNLGIRALKDLITFIFQFVKLYRLCYSQKQNWTKAPQLFWTNFYKDAEKPEPNSYRRVMSSYHSTRGKKCWSRNMGHPD